MSATPEGVTRPTFWRIGPDAQAVFYVLAAVAILVFGYGVYRRVARYRRGAEDPVPRFDRPLARLWRALRVTFGNRPILDGDRYAGVMHTFLVWGFVTLFVGTTILAIDIEIARLLFDFSFFVGDFYLVYSAVLDALGLLFVTGVGMALYRRYVGRLDRLGTDDEPEFALFLAALFLLGVGGYLVEGVRIYGTGRPPFETVSFVGWFLADLLAVAGVTPGAAAGAYPALWWSHALLALAFVAAVPYAVPLHLLTAFANVATADRETDAGLPGARLPGVPEDVAPEDVGAGTLSDLSWKQLLDHDACTKCGRCSSACPAESAGRPLDPREVVLDLRAVDDDGETLVGDGGVVATETMESCMACMACVDACPVDIEHVTQFTELRRRLTETGEVDDHVGATLMDIYRNGNQFGEPERRRPDWLEGVDVDLADAREEPVEFLWYVGDYPSYDPRCRETARALARLFDRADLEVGILYEDERNDGNDVRRVGEEGLFEMLAEETVATLEECEFETLVCTDPHSYNTFRNEYDQFGFERGDRVRHYTQVLVEHLDALSLDASLDRVATYHDPCHLGRFNGVYEPPRRLIEATGATLAEMPRNRSEAVCCGGGGGGVWRDFDEERPPSVERLREASEDTPGDVDTFVVACPQCTTMYEDGRKTGGYEALEVIDVAELLLEASEG
jgi:Fe-S oxidoreductase